MKKYLSVVCFIYVAIIIYVWLCGYLDNYLAPNMQIYLKLSLIPISIMGIVFLFCNISYKFKNTDLLLLVPLIFVLLARDGNLTASFAQNKIIKVNRNNTVISDDIGSIEIDMDNPLVEVDSDNIYFDIDDSIYSYLANYLSYMSGGRKFVGKSIRFKGFVVDYGDYLQDGYIAIGKYYISCCAADAEFATFFVKYDKSKVEDDSWYEVEGILELGKDSEGYDIMTVVPSKVKEISSKGEDQYVYTCDNYGNGKCSKLLSYDLEY